MILNVIDRAGKEHKIDAEEGWRVMEVIRDQSQKNKDIAIKAECGGALACATCHVYVDPAWADKMPSPTQDEMIQMDLAFDVRDNSRLSCQILMTKELDGLIVTLAPGSEP